MLAGFQLYEEQKKKKKNQVSMTRILCPSKPSSAFSYQAMHSGWGSMEGCAVKPPAQKQPIVDKNLKSFLSLNLDLDSSLNQT